MAKKGIPDPKMSNKGSFMGNLKGGKNVGGANANLQFGKKKPKG